MLLNHSSVEELHCEIETLRPRGCPLTVRVRALDGHEVVVNDKVTKNARLHNGDTLRVGKFLFRFSSGKIFGNP